MNELKEPQYREAVCLEKFLDVVSAWLIEMQKLSTSEKSRTIRLPIHITEKLNKIKKVQRFLSQQLGRTPSASELAIQPELIPKQVQEYLKWARQPQ